jgi:hypothetical protein|tara:strand:- start:9 stop:482 length:474 start_codon:yes stop_codon:yes gene_type:complete
MPKKDQKEKLSKVLKAGEKGKDKAITKIMEYIPGSSGPPKGLVDFMEPALRKAGKYFRDREEPLEDKKAEKARKDIKGEEPVKKKEMNMGRQASAGRGGNAPGRLGMAKRMPVPQATPTAPILPANPIPRPKPPGMSKGGKTRGYGMARGGKACKMM